MKLVAPFGFVTACHAGDKYMVGATLASIKNFCPQAPICLVADGDIDVHDLQQLYGLSVLRTKELPDIEMRELCCGSYYAKLSAMWEGPFEHFVWLDSDAIVWGDFTKQIDFAMDFQIFWSEISIPLDAKEVPPWLGHFYFDLEKVRHFDPNFEWRGWPYFSTGAFACKRNAISFRDWMKIKEWDNHFSDSIFKFGEQGQLQYMVHSGNQTGRIKVCWTDLQYVVLHHGPQEIQMDTVACGWRFPMEIKRPRVTHLCGQKPLIFNWKAYSKAFTIARLEHYRKTRGELGAWAAILHDELRNLFAKISRKLSKAFK
jgi:hypothetical protein